MHPSPSPARLIFLAVSVTFAAASALAQNAPRLPDMSSYDCAATSAATAASSRHVGQVIKGTYNEWHELYVAGTAGEKLGCIALMRPSPRQLTAGEARNFLLDSFAVGAPTASDAERNQATPDVVEPDNVQPEPLKRLRKIAPGTERPREAGPDLPPVPATRSFDGPQTSLPPKERPSRLAAPAERSEAPDTLGAEDREQIVDTQSYPWNTVAYVSVTYPSGTNFRCSGVLVSPYVVLTAGHCIHNNDRGGYVTSVRIYPGQTQAAPKDNNPVRPYGVKSDVQYLQTTAQWVQMSGEESYFISDYRHDLAAIEFRTPFTHTSTFMPVLYSSSSSPVTSVGYPGTINGDNNNYGQYADLGNETQDSFDDYRADHVREFAVDASGGNSGGPFIYASSNNQRYLVGVLSYAGELDDYAGGPWYDSWNQSLLSGWVSWTPGSTATGSVSGLRVASVFGSAQPSVASFLRFYNSGTSSGTVDVTLADAASGNVLATWTSPTLPARSSRQYSLTDIENGASGTFTKPMVYSISVRSTFPGTFQNAIFRKADATLSNISTCSGQATDGTTLINVHSSLLTYGYPSAIVIHNTSASALQVPLSVYSGQSGILRGTYTTASIPANSQLVLGIATIENGGGFTPAGDYHYNIRAGGGFTGYMQHLVNNLVAGVTTDMSTSCALVQQ